MENKFANFQVISYLYCIEKHFYSKCFFFFNFRYIDLQMMKDKVAKDNYKNVEEFRADILTFIHNIIIFHGGKLTFHSYIFCS